MRSGREPVSRRPTRVLQIAAVVVAVCRAPASSAELADLAAQCRAGGGDERVCRSLEQLGRTTGQVCRFPGAPDEVCTELDGRHLSEARVAAYEQSWVHRALRLQWMLDASRPLRDALIPATHNSFNSEAYPPTLSGLDHNQVYSLTHQLRMDMRGLELDVHWFPSPYADLADAGFAPILCHGEVVEVGPVPVHLGCTIERHLREGLAEIRAWLDANPSEFLLLYLENNLDGDPKAHEAAARAIAAELGERVLRPPDGAPCAPMPAGESRQSILDGGHRVLIVGNCGPGAWGTWVHERDQDATWYESSSPAGDDYPAYPQCAAQGGEREQHQYDTRFIRYYEDSTWLSVMVDGKPSQMTLADTERMVRCGVNLTGFDQLVPEDPRLEAVVWSWAKDEPSSDATGQCALQDDAGRFRAADCATSLRYACRRPDGSWMTTSQAGPWADGFATCSTEVLGSSFSVPATGYENERLKAARVPGAGVWLDYAVSGSPAVWSPNLPP